MIKSYQDLKLGEHYEVLYGGQWQPYLLAFLNVRLGSDGVISGYVYGFISNDEKQIEVQVPISDILTHLRVPLLTSSDVCLRDTVVGCIEALGLEMSHHDSDYKKIALYLPQLIRNLRKDHDQLATNLADARNTIAEAQEEFLRLEAALVSLMHYEEQSLGAITDTVTRLITKKS